MVSVKVGNKRSGIRPRAFSMIEVLASLAILSIVALNVSGGTILSYKTYKRSVRNSAATALALDKLEEYSLVDPATLDDNDDLSELSVTANGLEFTRTVDVTVNADNSVTVEVEVLRTEPVLGGWARYQTTFVSRGAQ